MDRNEQISDTRTEKSMLYSGIDWIAILFRLLEKIHCIKG